jgi:LPS-assembly protein
VRIYLPAALTILALVALSPPASAAETAATSSPGSVPVELRADQLTYDSAAGVLLLEGHVVVDRADARLRASRGRLDRKANVLTLEGGVVAAQANQIVTADSARIDLEARSSDLAGAILFIKESGPDLRQVEDPSRARGVGRNTLSAKAQGVAQEPGGGLRLSTVVATPCECAVEPDYEIEARKAFVKDDRAALEGSHLKLLGGSVPLFPLSLPLLDRQSGLLAPQLGFSQISGFRYSQPIYWVLDRSWDVTLTPGFLSGSVNTNPALALRSIQGPRIGAELRWAPAEGVSGELDLDLVKDFAESDSTLVDSRYPGERPTMPGRGWAGFRGSGRRAQRIEAGAWTFAVVSQLASDTMILPDAQPAQLDRYLDVLRTDVGLWRSDGAESWGFAATGLQDVRSVWFSSDRRLFGPEARSVPQRFPAPFLQLLPRALGPLVLGGEASAAWVANVSDSAMERATGFGPSDLGAWEYVNADPSSRDLSRPMTLRFDAAPRLTWALPAGWPIRGRLLFGGRGDGLLHPTDSARDVRRLQGFVDAEGSVLIAGPIGDFVHSIEPRLQLRAIAPSLFGGGSPLGDPADGGGPVWVSAPDEAEQGASAAAARDPGSAGRTTTLGVPAWRRGIDDVDGSAPSTGAVEATFAIRQALWSRGAPSQAPGRVAWLLLQQDLVAWNGEGKARAADGIASMGLGLSWLTLSLDGRWDWLTNSVSLLDAGARLRDSRGDSLSLGGRALRSGAADRIHAGIDELFAATRFAALAGDLAGTLSAGLVWALPTQARGLQLSADLSWTLSEVPVGVPNRNASLTFAWKPPCGCAMIALGVVFNFIGSQLQSDIPDISFSFALKSLGR